MVRKLLGFGAIALGIFLEVTWLSICFGSIIIGLVLLFFAPRILFFPFNFFLLVGLSILAGRNFSRDGFKSYQYSSNSEGFSGFSTFNNLDRYYEILECSKEDDFATIKKNYRRLMKQYHYDNLVSQNLSEDELEKAKQKSQDINEAYEALKKLRD